MTYTGQCSCGAVMIAIEGEPVTTRQCWCRQCQKIAAGGATNNAIFPLEAITIEGERAQSRYVAASGATLTHEFCLACGTHVLAHSSARPLLRTIRLGLLDEGHGLAPAAAIWTSEAPAWAVVDPALEQWPQQPPPPSHPTPP
ncbi:hypothetical protein HNO88_000039 [Novosphingobium chloroacetimidivorans]|uniref:CENP-V/GFA domain-containing protein n=1 Tax=Novosphingobium chloroacetimidivorans TaxID=1428314 RepID=A0A7W7K5Q1_9SPHN|nr:GFA family protein [Novosphingobium chloroacetimidivorans]MBB4856742.1 hypothetical protein [Novosphingobium chloroacetimidivorans]